jgi:hypothetical protein
VVWCFRARIFRRLAYIGTRFRLYHAPRVSAIAPKVVSRSPQSLFQLLIYDFNDFLSFVRDPNQTKRIVDPSSSSGNVCNMILRYRAGHSAFESLFKSQFTTSNQSTTNTTLKPCSDQDEPHYPIFRLSRINESTAILYHKRLHFPLGACLSEAYRSRSLRQRHEVGVLIPFGGDPPSFSKMRAND